MKRIAFGFALGVIFVFALDVVAFETHRDRAKRKHERLPFTRWETQDWDEDDPDVPPPVGHEDFWVKKTNRPSLIDGWSAGS